MNIDKRFIVLEGGDFTGKTSVSNLLVSTLRDAGFTVTQTREPGGCSIAEKLRALLLSNDTSLSPISELLIFTAARLEHMKQTIIPALKRDEIVVCDRFLASTFAYQGYIKNIPASTILTSTDLIFDGFAGAYLLSQLHTILLDVPHEAIEQRRLSRGEALNRLDVVDKDLYEGQRLYYKSLPRRAPNIFKNTKFSIVDGHTGPIEETVKRIINTVRGEEYESTTR
jgi:dTMP kinase